MRVRCWCSHGSASAQLEGTFDTVDSDEATRACDLTMIRAQPESEVRLPMQSHGSHPFRPRSSLCATSLWHLGAAERDRRIGTARACVPTALPSNRLHSSASAAD